MLGSIGDLALEARMMTPTLYRNRLKKGFRWQRNFMLRRRLVRYARLKPHALPMPRVVNNNGCITGVWLRFMRRVRAKHPDGYVERQPCVLIALSRQPQ